MNNETKYYLGLDIGTSSVGWAVTDENYKILRSHGKALWGVRLFEAAKSAQERRVFRSGRRRLQRRVERIRLLQELFAEEISKVDLGFYQRLHDSYYYEEDKTIIQKNTLFAEKNFDDKVYHQKYPTIYHLRKELIDCDTVHDIREVYLAIHHIIKHRGHFLFSGQKIDVITSIKTSFREFQQVLKDEMQIELVVDHVETVEEILKAKDGISKKEKNLKDVFHVDTKDKQRCAILGLIAGGKKSLSHVFADESLEDFEKNKISFADGNFEENQNVLEEALGERYYVLAKIKTIYDWAILADTLQGKESLSYAKTAIYDKHRKDLILLKNAVKKYLSKEKFIEIFRSSEEKYNYCAYIGMCKKNGKKIAIKDSKCNQELLCKYLRGIFKNISNESDQHLIYLKQEMELNTLLPKAVSKDNSVIPYQLQEIELKKILANAKKYLPFLNQTDEKGLSVCDKILAIFKFRIPYYVGPVNGAHKEAGFYWAELKIEGKVYPWNFDERIDVEKSAEAFIKRMTNKCTYLSGEDVLPKASLAYQEFMVLNELNNLQIHDEKISVELKKDLYQNLFEKYKKVTIKRLTDYLVAKGVLEAKEKEKISGIDGDFKSSLSTYLDFSRIFCKKKVSLAILEQLVSDITIFGDAKDLLKKRLKSYSCDFSDEEMRELLTLRYKD
ncbi:MAG: CRISPR-associated endonuclease, Csn1 family [Firmicutes bacterium]|nr:CRISPR-associated endonuclease, Csn1 family [Bacillota bacterium]